MQKRKAPLSNERFQEREIKIFQATQEIIKLIWENESYDIEIKKILINKLHPGSFTTER